MRIISQDKCYDLPYEQTAIAVYGTEIAGYSLDNTRYCTLASYSTEEKAIKAMEMCIQEYGKYFSVQGGVSAITGAVTQPGIFTYPKVFQFPKEEEVE